MLKKEITLRRYCVLRYLLHVQRAIFQPSRNDRVAMHKKKRTGKRSERGRFLSELKSFVRAFHGMMFIFHKH